MKDYRKIIASHLAPHLEIATEEEIAALIELPKYTDMGDFAFPCFRYAKALKKAPNLIAAELAEKVSGDPLYEKVEAASAYVNFTMDKAQLAEDVLKDVLELGDLYGSSTKGEGKTVIVEFSSTNIAKPFHMGHIRSTMIGNALYRIHKFLGYNTIGINHLGDYGTQFGKLIVAFKLWGDRATIEADPIPELLKIYVKFHDEAEVNPSLEDEARNWFKRLEDNDPEAYELWEWFRDISLKEFSRVYGMLDVHFDSYAGESFYSDKMPAVLEEMRQKSIMKVSDGAEIVDLEPYGMPPALITKKDGSTLYLTRDITAAIYRKNHYNFDKNVYVVGAPQKLHFQQWMKVVELMGYDWVKDCVHVEFGTVSLEEGSLSTRKGRVVFLEEVLKKAVEKTKEIIAEKNPNLEHKDEVAAQVGIGAVVFQELSNNRIKDYTFSLDKTLSFDGETGPYVQYTHARACSVLRKAAPELLKQPVDFSKLGDSATSEVVKLIRQFPEIVIDAGEKYEPSLITRYVVNLAQEFNRFYHDHPILSEDEVLSTARLALVDATRQTIKNALFLISLKAPVKM
ncbi:arginine--tRNA ligase [Acidaminobacter hydrogenoformans]|uniref:Arginine--tRNA ligase n=1 Tax=Acidaminobacter hydrogenoformans DSM 2784 TaxID=1120920 RepID=A0A1G5RU80_9FIRM|nr:arginine--tRNA ligase [Acidaminobacter hydrogenoformans]SCZ77556.1 arginyl-tRNA synthetase [Acidaminobacter hydrogenoformans DSM 2784]